MSKRTKRGIMTAGVFVIALVVTGLVVQFRPGVTQDAPAEDPTTPSLFARSYAEGHDRAGFSGRPMLLVFGDRRTPDWDHFLVDCEKNPKLVGHLQSKFQGVFVDAVNDAEAMATYGNPEIGTVLVKDLHGPIRGILREKYTCADLSRILDEALPYISIEKSPGYTRLLAGTDVLDELVGKASELEALGGTDEATKLRDEAAKLVSLLGHFEPETPVLQNAKVRAQELDIAVETK